MLYLACFLEESLTTYSSIDHFLSDFSFWTHIHHSQKKESKRKTFYQLDI